MRSPVLEEHVPICSYQAPYESSGHVHMYASNTSARRNIGSIQTVVCVTDTRTNLNRASEDKVGYYTRAHVRVVRHSVYY